MKRIFSLACLIAITSLAYAQDRTGLDVQEARKVHVTTRAKKVFYTRTWDLSGLPDYKPQQSVSGTIREWGSNYPADSDLNKYWTDEFHKSQPNVKFEVNMRTALESAAALATGVADIAACRAFTFSDEELYERAHDHEPLRILVATGSWNVPGWSPALAIVVNKDNPINQLSMRQIDDIFGAGRTGGYQGTTWHLDAARPDSENIRTWGQLGLTGKWKDAPIHVYGLNLHYGMANDFANMVFHGGDKWNEHLIEYANYAAADGTLKIGADQLMQRPIQRPLRHRLLRRNVPHAANQDARPAGQARRPLHSQHYRDGAEPHLPHAPRTLLLSRPRPRQTCRP